MGQALGLGLGVRTRVRVTICRSGTCVVPDGSCSVRTPRKTTIASISGESKEPTEC
jgi:hypothetical protein